MFLSTSNDDNVNMLPGESDLVHDRYRVTRYMDY